MKLELNAGVKPTFRRWLILSLVLFVLAGCGGGSGGGSGGDPGAGSGGDSGGDTPVPPPLVTPELTPIQISGIALDLGNFDPAPTVAADGTIWMSYSHVSLAPTGIKLIETRLATTDDAGLNWRDAGLLVNTATSLPLPAPGEVNAVAHEVSRLVYNPFAEAAGADPWLLLWHRYLSLFTGETVRLFEHGWIGMKSGASTATLGGERKLFTGVGYDIANNSDALGVPEYPLASMNTPALGNCVIFTEPGVLPKSNGIYVSLLCAEASPPGKIILLHCGHDMGSCSYLGTLVDGAEAGTIDPSYNGFSASELVSINGQDYLIVTPTASAGNLYRGCVAYKITDLENAVIERSEGTPLASLILAEHGDFNGACGYVEELTGSGIIMSEAFFTEAPTFRMFATDVHL